jgi:PEP-CTERM motif
VDEMPVDEIVNRDYDSRVGRCDMRRNLRRSILILITVALVAVGSAPRRAGADAIELITNGEFGTDSAPSLAGWNVGGVLVHPGQTEGVAQARSGTDVINTSEGNAGFNGFFTSAFATLGDSDGPIGGGPNSPVIISSIWESFTVPSFVDGKPVYAIDVSFDFAFNGSFSPTPTRSSWLALIGTVPSFSPINFGASPDSDVFPDCGPAPSCPTGLFSGTVTNFFNFTPGDYAIGFRLGEIGPGDVALGIDNVSIEPVPIPEPTTLVLLGTGLVAAAVARRKRLRMR